VDPVPTIGIISLAASLVWLMTVAEVPFFLRFLRTENKDSSANSITIGPPLTEGPAWIFARCSLVASI
jgi:hypothetical protein